MIQTIVTPAHKQFDMSVLLPNNYVGKQVHVLFYIDDEVKNTTPIISKTKATALKTVRKSNLEKNIKKGLEEVQLFKKGKLKTTSAKDFLNEL